ncbi:alpha/beta fold hydrolase [Maricaulis sp.]|uniref:alpha/beta hydrolase family protein n=1 Tax=Maricaulis sp. TaxID=1486257 RepID=UPI000C68C04B|nr:alpha/beta fold hydrolase [Maricaulis sp.]MAC90604.1 peptidase S15 [Maricaulis sp.]
MPIIRTFSAWLTGLLLALVMTLAQASADDSPNAPPSGDWLGILSTPGGELRLLITATEQPDGSHRGELESLDQAPGQKIPINEFAIDSDTMRFAITAMGASYSGEWNDQTQRYEGEFSQGMTLPLAFARPAAVEVTVIDGIDGVWEGMLTRGETELAFTLNIETGEDGTQVALDSVTQAAYGIPVTDITRDGDAVGFRIPAANVTYRGELNAQGDRLTGQWIRPGFPEAEVIFQRTAEIVTGPNRPQEPVGPFPYGVEPVRFDNPEAEGVTLAGTLTLPAGDGPFPAAILISGSGPQDRDETVWTHRPFAVLADHLTRNGIAVLRYDDRGFAESTGDFASSTSMDFASDTEAALAWLRARPEIDASAIGLIGHSEGGLIAPVVAADNDAVAFLVLLAGPGTTGEQIILDQSLAAARAGGRSPEELDVLARLIPQITGTVSAAADEEAARSALNDLFTDETLALLGAAPAQRELLISQNVRAWQRNFLRHDPADFLPQVDQPVLAVNGSLDLQVLPAPNLAGLEAGLSGNPEVTVMELEGLNHMFQTAQTGTIAEYAEIEETFAPHALDLISDWIAARFGN